MTLSRKFEVPLSRDPAELFAELWPQVEPFTSEIIQEPWAVSQYREYDTFSATFLEHDGPAVPDEITDYLAGGTNARWQVASTDCFKRAFVVMRSFDRACRALLPEAIAFASGTLMTPPGDSLNRLRDRLFIQGRLAATEAGQVVLRGPLASARRSADPEVCNGDHFCDQFANLTLVPALAQGRKLNFEALSPSDFQLSENAVHAVGLAPIAEDADDLRFETSERGDRCYLDALPSDPARLASRAAKTVASLIDTGARLVALPELVIASDTIDAVATELRSRGTTSEALVVLGSGLFEYPEAKGLRFNESVVLDGRGRELFRQRKLHHYSMTAQRMMDCGITPIRDEPHIENVATGDVLEVRDLPGLGRVMVLICEDFAQLDPGGLVARALRPDWIVVPVLDLPQKPGRWPHKRAFGSDAGSRVIVSCSATLGVRAENCGTITKLPPETGLGVLYDGAVQGAVYIVEVGCDPGHDLQRLVDWQPDGWEVTFLTKKPRG